MLLLLISSLLVAVHAQDYECGRTKLDAEDGFLTGEAPNEAIAGLSPWTMSLELQEEEEWGHVCGAALIDTEWALTSARCVTEFGSGEFRLIAGVIDRTERSGEEQIIPVDSFIIHPDFDGDSASYPNDLAILALGESANLTLRINPICLPPTSDTKYYENPNSVITGWGVLDNESEDDYPNVLHSAWIDALRPAFCDLWWNNTSNSPVNHDYHQCVFDSVNRQMSICRGDLGGPLQSMVDGIFDLAAIASFHAEGCNRLLPSVYTDIPMHLDWIVGVTGVLPRP